MLSSFLFEVVVEIPNILLLLFPADACVRQLVLSFKLDIQYAIPSNSLDSGILLAEYLSID